MPTIKEIEEKLIIEAIAAGEMERGADGKLRITPAHWAHMLAESKKFLTCPNCGNRL